VVRGSKSAYLLLLLQSAYQAPVCRCVVARGVQISDTWMALAMSALGPRAAPPQRPTVCRCNERRKALTKALTATAQGDATALKTQLAFVATTSAEDAAAAVHAATRSLTTAVAQARTRLGALRR
jgi:hypothetical protein